MPVKPPFLTQRAAVVTGVAAVIVAKSTEVRCHRRAFLDTPEPPSCSSSSSSTRPCPALARHRPAPASRIHQREAGVASGALHGGRRRRGRVSTAAGGVHRQRDAWEERRVRKVERRREGRGSMVGDGRGMHGGRRRWGRVLVAAGACVGGATPGKRGE
ncbi:hypothetical protein E2562_037112 [Oryza meyeriana var. granulata]|uniref:Uncharacterized protein n=1 Tax=Oryza meyeriana var. granulata TaxID=110450 RepID=A0A6G1E7U9_9ORYZ|nr:hypothetical protein E2562_037112 [Oryza meyeriana var. granulata]